MLQNGLDWTITNAFKCNHGTDRRPRYR